MNFFLKKTIKLYLPLAKTSPTTPAKPITPSLGKIQEVHFGDSHSCLQ